MSAPLLEEIKNALVVTPSGISINEGGKWLTWSAVRNGDKVDVHAAFPAGAVVSLSNGLVVIDVALPADGTLR